MANIAKAAVIFFKKHREIVTYLIFGVLTTFVNYIIFGLFLSMFGITEDVGNRLWMLVANAIAWVGAVLFAFVTNKLFVFGSRARGVRVVAREALLFAGGRLITLAIETGVIFLGLKLYDWLSFPEQSFNLLSWAVKAVASVIVIVLNYIISKLFIFRSGDKTDGQEKQAALTDSTGLQ